MKTEHIPEKQFVHRTKSMTNTVDVVPFFLLPLEIPTIIHLLLEKLSMYENKNIKVDINAIVENKIMYTAVLKRGRSID